MMGRDGGVVGHISRWTTAYVLLFLALCLVVLNTPQIKVLDLRISDAIQLAQPQEPSDEVLIVDLDFKAIDNVGEPVLPNSFYAKVISHLDKSSVRKLYLDRRLSIVTNPKNDQALAIAMKQMGPDRIAIPGYNQTASQSRSGPHPIFSGLATLVGGSFIPDTDGRYRNLSTGIEVVTDYPNPAMWLAGSNDVKSVSINQKFDPSQFNRISAWDVVKLSSEELENKTIIMGMPTTIVDSGLTYTNGAVLDRATFIALAYETVRTNSKIKHLDWYHSLLALLVVGVFSLLCWFALQFLKNKHVIRIAFVLLGGLAVASIGFFFLSSLKIQLPIVGLFSAFGLANLIYAASKLKLIEVVYEIFSGDLSTEEALAWRSVAKQDKMLVLLGFNTLKRQSGLVVDAGFFCKENPNLVENQTAILGALKHGTVDNTIVLKVGEEVRHFRIENLLSNIPLVRLDDISVDVAEKQAMETALHTDDLTGCLNRAGLFARAEEQKGAFAIIVMDMNGFKAVNDTLGHAAGDELLRIAAQNFKSVLDHDDEIARLGGDEFCIILPNFQDPNLVRAKCATLEACLNDQVEISGQKVKISVAAGYSLALSKDDIDVAFDSADKAMYERKRRLKNAA